MAMKPVVFVVLLFVSVAMCKPRDSTAVHTQDSILQDVNSQSPKAETAIAASQSPEAEPSAPEPNGEVHIPGRISCPYEDATEDSACLEHCVPKGYSYGICVSKTCSCI